MRNWRASGTALEHRRVCDVTGLRLEAIINHVLRKLVAVIIDPLFKRLAIRRHAERHRGTRREILRLRNEAVVIREVRLDLDGITLLNCRHKRRKRSLCIGREVRVGLEIICKLFANHLGVAHRAHFLEVRRTIVHTIREIRVFTLFQLFVEIAGHIIAHAFVRIVIRVVRLHVQIDKRNLVVLGNRLHHAAGIVVVRARREHVAATVQVHRRDEDDIGALALASIDILLDESRELRRLHITRGL